MTLWQMYWADPDGGLGALPVEAPSLQEAHALMDAAHPGVRAVAFRDNQLNPQWRQQILMEWCRAQQ